MLETPAGCQSESTPSGEPTEPCTGEPPPTTPTPEVKVPPAPAAVNVDGSGTIRLGEVLDRGEDGRYTVKDCLGRGGMGEVYRAEYVGPEANGLVQVFEGPAREG